MTFLTLLCALALSGIAAIFPVNWLTKSLLAQFSADRFYGFSS
jgi:hypothetical protein